MSTYQKTYGELFDSQCGRETLPIVQQCIEKRVGPFSAGDIIDDACKARGCVDSWNVLNSLDHFVTMGLIRELTAGKEVWGQHRQFERLT